MGNSCFGKPTGLKTINEIYYYNYDTNDDEWITHNNHHHTPEKTPTIDWEDDISVEYVCECNSNTNRALLVKTGCDWSEHLSNDDTNPVTFANDLNQSFIVSYSNLMQNAQCAPHPLHPILRKPKRVGTATDNNSNRSLINFISRPSCFETPEEYAAPCCCCPRPPRVAALERLQPLLLLLPTKKKTNSIPLLGVEPRIFGS